MSSFFVVCAKKKNVYKSVLSGRKTNVSSTLLFFLKHNHHYKTSEVSDFLVLLYHLSVRSLTQEWISEFCLTRMPSTKFCLAVWEDLSIYLKKCLDRWINYNFQNSSIETKICKIYRKGKIKCTDIQNTNLFKLYSTLMI